jgi:DNA uptake protein ComE-like DNA-binding protein
MTLRSVSGWAAAAAVTAVAALAAAQGQTTAPAQGQARTFTPEEMAAMAQAMAPGEARDLTIRVCAQCHEPQRVGALRLTREAWEEVVQKMVGLGARATPAELEQITDYLAVNYKGEAPKPINMNSASAVDLEAVATLLRKESAAWIAYRNKNGPCKSLDDLKKVPGVPFKKIDERRDRLVCF